MQPQPSHAHPNTLASERGAFDLPSIITGVVVVGVLTAGVLASVFGVIPFAQDNGAKQDLSAVRTAQGVQLAKHGAYLDKSGLAAAGLTGSLPAKMTVTSTGAEFCASTVSGAGNTFLVTSDNSVVRPGACTKPFDFTTPPAWTLQTGAGNGGWYDDLAISADGTKVYTGTTSPSGSILRSSDSGATWAASTGVGGGDFVSAAASDDGTKLVGGRNRNYLQTSTDSGATWVARIGPGLANWSGVASSGDGMKLAAVEDKGGVWTSADGGVNWTNRTNAGSGTTGGTWTGIGISDDGTKLVAGRLGGMLYTSADSGATWKAHSELPTIGSWYSLATTPDGKNMIAADADEKHNKAGAAIYISTDSGATWTKQTSAGNKYWVSVASSDDGTKLVAGVRDGYVYISVNGGAS